VIVSVGEDGLVMEPESKTREYKRDLSNPDSVLEIVVAFANTAGGQIVVGVGDDRNVVGVENPLVEEVRFANLVADRISPQVLPGLELMTVEGKTLLIAEVAVGSQPPYRLRQVGGRKVSPEEGTYVRLGSTDRRISPALVDELRRARERVSFDQLPAGRAALTDLDPKPLEVKLGRRLDEAGLRTLELVVEDQGRLVPSNAGVLLASPTPRRFLPSAEVMCARFHGRERLDLLDQLEFTGPLHQAPDAIEEFLKKHAFLTAEFGETMHRRDVWSIPMRAIRELVVNAIVHAVYAETSAVIRVAFLDDRIEIDNPGMLLPGLTVEAMKQGVSRIRNPVIARVFRELNLMERWGTGFRSVVKELHERGLPDPEVIELPGIVRVVAAIPDHRPQIAPRSGTTRGLATATGRDVPGRRELGDAATQEPTQETQEPTALGPHGFALLASVEDEPLTRAELMRSIGLYNNSRAFRTHVAPLLRAGWVAMTNPDRPNLRTQKYAITDQGRRVLTGSTADRV
jgi:predicted HTH transcriptional regulator